MARLAVAALALLLACTLSDAFFYHPYFYGGLAGLYGGGLYGGGGTTVVVVNGRRHLQANSAPCRSALDVMRATPQLSQLAALAPSMSPKLRDALASTAADGAPFTLFAPSNAALASLVAALPDADDVLMRNSTLLTALLSYHIVPGQLLRSDALLSGAGAPLRTALGADVPPLRAAAGGNGNGAATTLLGVGSRASVVQPDLAACHGTIHVIDRVLLPLPLGDAKMPRPGDMADTVKSAMTAAQG